MSSTGSTCTLIITMAGAGLRFRDAGFSQPKYELNVHGRSLFLRSQSSLQRWIDADARWVFVTRAEYQARSFLSEQCATLGIRRFSVVELENPTDGQATTARAAADSVENTQKPVAIYNIDTYVEPAYLDPALVRGDGWIPCFPGSGAQWSFARVDAADRVLEVREKLRISDHATVGFYWFSSFDLFLRAYDAYYVEGERAGGGERYVAPLYNQLIDWDCSCFIGRIPAAAVVGLGTPADVEAYDRAIKRGPEE
jgi:hypothetical protein